MSVIVAIACNRPEPAPPVAQEEHYAVCDKRTEKSRYVYVEVDSLRRVLVCAFERTPELGQYHGTPIVNRIGDTLFVAAKIEAPDRGGPGQVAMMVGLLPYDVMFGPLAAHSRLRVTNRVRGQPPISIPTLDTVVRIP